jgi:uncharacterized protein YjbJ (UPF0337 family)
MQMSTLVDKAKGVGNEAVGMAKVAVGKGMHNAQLVAEGTAQEEKGKAQLGCDTVKNKVSTKKSKEK